MKKYRYEIAALLAQLTLFYVYPFFALRIDPMGAVLIMLFLTLMLSAIMATLTKNKLCFLFPAIVAIIFLPSLFMYYNESASIHSLWYFIASLIGTIFGKIIKRLIEILFKQK